MNEENEQPDKVCCCGKTSEGICPRCGQKITEEASDEETH
jgi:hypothetical protein